MKTLSVLTAILLALVSARADVKLNPIFDDHAVLQRDIPVSVYGTAEPGEKVTVAFAGQTKAATTDKEGAWSVKLAAMKACTNSATMTVTGKNKLTLNDVVVGDVWICSGQSNMDFTPGAYHNALDPKPYDEKDFDVPLLRQFHLINEPQGKLKHFAIAGDDKKWAWADAVIDGKTVVVSSPEVPKPVAVRYAYTMSGDDCNLYNNEGLPASPFRTDDW